VGIERGLHEPAELNEDGSVRRTVRDVIVQEARTGLPAEIAAQYAGITGRTYRRWLSDGRAVLRRLQETPDDEVTDMERDLAQLATDVQAAQAFWVRNANVVLERAMRGRERISVKVKTERQLNEAGEEVEVEVERTTTTSNEPVELGPLMWRLGKIAPQVYGPTTRVELTGADGGAVELDIGKRLDEHLAKIAEALAVEPEPESTNGNGHHADPV
jgi:hypothetical protein